MHAFLRFLVRVYYEILTVHLSDCVHGYHNMFINDHIQALNIGIDFGDYNLGALLYADA